MQRGVTQQPGLVSNSLPTATRFCREAESQSIGWDRSPIRRKHHKRKSKSKPKTTPLTPALKCIALTLAVVSFYTCPDRALPHIILMESSLITYHLLYFGQFVGDAFRFLFELASARNRLMHSLVGNTTSQADSITTLQLNSLLFYSHPTSGICPPKIISLCDSLAPIPEGNTAAYPRNTLLAFREPKTTPQVTAPPITPSLAHRPLSTRGGRRRTLRVGKHKIILPKPQIKTHNFQRSKGPLATPQGLNHRPREFKPNSTIKSVAKEPAPPPSGAPGAATAANEECKPLPAGKNNAKFFRHLILRNATHKGPQRKKQLLPLATPPMDYGVTIKVGAQNVQGIAELLKHQQCLDIMIGMDLHLLFLTETKTTTYYTYNSQGHLFIINGAKQDKYGGISAIVSPSMRPYVKDVFQHSSRILHVVIASSSGDTHFIGVYAPHDKLDFETVKAPFWLLLQEVLDKISQPEPVYILGDWNIRLQGRKANEQDVLGPHVYGKGVLYAKTGPERNRDLYINLLKSTDSCDVLTYKTPNLLHQVTYRDKAPPPIDWGQFALDSIRVLQFWDKVAGLPIPEEESLIIGQTIRGFLTEEPLMQTTPLKPQVDPYRFQSLDRLVTRRKWLPSVKNARARHDTGFPSDHYLIISHVQVKLGAKPPVPPRPPRLDYAAEEEKLKEFQRTFRAAHANSREREPPHKTESYEYQVYTDGSGSRGQATSATPAGWGVFMQQGHSYIEGYGRVNTDYSSPFYLGATVGSNNTAELSAIMEAMLYLLQVKVKPGKVVINYDSKWAANDERARQTQTTQSNGGQRATHLHATRRRCSGRMEMDQGSHRQRGKRKGGSTCGARQKIHASARTTIRSKAPIIHE